MLSMRNDLTLIVPTYRRPKHLGRLLTYLARQTFEGRVLVADSSPEPERAENAVIVAASPLCPKLRHFDPETPPFEKFAQIAMEAETPFTLLCADDDILLPGSLPPILAALRADPGLSAAHGWYFGFRNGKTFDFERIIYNGPSTVGDAPLDRLNTFLADYQSITYAVYRTAVLQEVLNAMRRVDGLLFRELGAGVLTALKGRVARLPVVYHGRSLEASHNYCYWHPLDYLQRSPETLLRHYAAYRHVLAENCPDVAGPEPLRMVDLLHLRYFADYLQPDLLTHLIDHIQRGTENTDAFADLYGMLPRAEGNVMRALRQTEMFQKLRRAMGGRMRQALFSMRQRVSWSDETSSVTASGVARTYRLHRTFLEALRPFPHRRQAVAEVLKQLDAYE